jgi:hypothetical protein
MAIGDSYISVVKADFDADQKQASWDTKAVGDYADYDAYLAAMTDVDGAIQAWCIGRDVRTVIAQVLIDNGGGSASSPVAQGNLRLILEGQDTVTGNIYKYPIPMPDLTKANDGGGDPAWIKVGQGSNSLTVANPAHADYATLQTRFEANVLSPNGNAVVLVRAYVEE